jgi:hypothetical protein
MRIRAVAPIVLAVFLGLAAEPAAAGEGDPAQPASNKSFVAFLNGHLVSRIVPAPELAACKADGSTCTSDSDCCSGQCKPAGESRVCVPK